MKGEPMERKIYTQSTGERAQPVVQPTISVASAQLPPIPTAGEREAIPTTGDAPNAHGQEIAVEKSPYAPDKLILYQTSLGLLETLVKRGVLTKNDFKKACQVLTRKYGLPANSIFAESPL
jgi:hypothetical protein